ncbi:hypothetical protein EYS14_02785 [Alteromonadaceae bacterium M269]|nr:hypothetical protein EYS14_02785 [Alteromonadaceae bacterium M269]
MKVNAIDIKQSVLETLRLKKYAGVRADDYVIPSNYIEAKNQFWRDWQSLEPDHYLKGNSSFRYRRFCYFYYHPEDDELAAFANTPYYQPAELNSYVGGIFRHFSPMQRQTLDNRFLHDLIRVMFKQFPLTSEMRSHPWKLDVHQVRIVGSAKEKGEPTPEGIHHDENDFVSMHLVNRQNAIGGISGVYNTDKQPIDSITLTEPMDSLLVWDQHVMHAVSPIHPLNPDAEAIRDVLIIGYSHEPLLQHPSEVTSDDLIQSLKEQYQHEKQEQDETALLKEEE